MNDMAYLEEKYWGHAYHIERACHVSVMMEIFVSCCEIEELMVATCH